MNIFHVEEPQTIEFKTRPGEMLKIHFAGGHLYHLQICESNLTKVKFPESNKYTSNCFATGSTPGIEKPAKIEVDKQDRFFNPRLFHVVFNSKLNGTQAQIYYEIGRCEVGPRFQTLPFQVQKFILEHEKAHCFYSDEFSCDKWALNSYLQQGYNATQAFIALDQYLSKAPENIQRIKAVYNQLKTLQKK